MYRSSVCSAEPSAHSAFSSSNAPLLHGVRTLLSALSICSRLIVGAHSAHSPIPRQTDRDLEAARQALASLARQTQNLLSSTHLHFIHSFNLFYLYPRRALARGARIFPQIHFSAENDHPPIDLQRYGMTPIKASACRRA